MSEFISVSRNGKTLEIIFDKPKVNAICAATSRELGQVYAEFRDDPELRVSIFSCAGDGIFSAGWDLKAAEQREDYRSGDGQRAQTCRRIDSWSTARPGRDKTGGPAFTADVTRAILLVHV